MKNLGYRLRAIKKADSNGHGLLSAFFGVLR